jgi:hypothetical protein
VLHFSVFCNLENSNGSSQDSMIGKKIVHRKKRKLWVALVDPA